MSDNRAPLPDIGTGGRGRNYNLSRVWEEVTRKMGDTPYGPVYHTYLTATETEAERAIASEERIARRVVELLREERERDEIMAEYRRLTRGG